MSLPEGIKAVFDFSKQLVIIDEKFKRHEKQIKRSDDLTASLNDRLHNLTTRVAVLEEGRNTTDANVKRVITETIASWQVERAQQDLREAREQSEVERRRIAGQPPESAVQ
ncbi:MAG: hypothetical protein H7Y38_15080 [Armatimonadetes bacterium]|nr:hypothetical protein [Armatimonadota bacterium]